MVACNLLILLRIGVAVRCSIVANKLLILLRFGAVRGVPLIPP